MRSTFVHPLWGTHEGFFHEFSPCLATLSAAIAKDSYQRQQDYKNTLAVLGFEDIQLFDDTLQMVLARKEVSLAPDERRTIYAFALPALGPSIFTAWPISTIRFPGRSCRKTNKPIYPGRLSRPCPMLP